MPSLDRGAANQRKAIWTKEGFHCEIDIKVGPIQMAWRLKLNIEKLAYRRVAEPRKIVEGDEDLKL